MLFPCPYCHALAVPLPPDAPRPHAKCQHCGAKPRAVISSTQAGAKLIKYVREGRKASEPTEVVRVRLYRRQVEKYKDSNLSEVIRQVLDIKSPSS